MTITEYMNNLTLESMSVANEMANDAMLYDFYSSYGNEENAIATESADLTFDDEDIASSYSEPATEAGFFKNIGSKFKSMLETIKGWFEKVASTIKGWITKFAERIKNRITAAKAKKQAQTLAGIDADEKATSEAMAKKQAEIEAKITNLEKQRASATGSAAQKINNEIEKLNTQKEELLSKVQATVDKFAIQRAQVYSQSITTGVNNAEKAFKIACDDQTALKNMMLKIVNTKLTPDSKTSALVQDKIQTNPETGEYMNTKATVAALKKVEGTSKMLSDLNSMTDRLDKVEADVKDGVAKANEAYEKFSESCPDSSTMTRALMKVKVRLPANDLVAKASFMADNCSKYAEDSGKLARLFGDEPAEGSTGADKRPEIAKVLSAYSKVASKLVSIANAYLNIAGKGEMAAAASEMA